MFVQEMTYPGGTRLLVWRLEEEASQLLAMSREAEIHCEDLVGLPVKRQREKAAERLLLYQAFGHPVTLSHTEQGAPYLVNESINLSITHTLQMVAVALDDQRTIGLDAEQMDRRQVLRVRDKFLNSGEQQFIASDDLAAHVIAWTAKEAVIKAERNSALDWTDGISLEPFAVDSDETSLIARCGNRRYRLSCRQFMGHMLTLAAIARQ